MGRKDPAAAAANMMANRGLVARVLGGVPVPQPEPDQEGAGEAAEPASAPPPAPVRQRQKAPPSPPAPVRTVAFSCQVLPEQVASLRELSVKRCNARGYGRADMSELVRRALERFLADPD
jgi:hypothetical protein